MKTVKALTLREFNNDEPITYLWICGVACPAGQDFYHATDTDMDGPDEYCDFGELPILDRLWELEGYVDDHGRWCLHDDSDVRDWAGNTIYNVKASR